MPQPTGPGWCLTSSCLSTLCSISKRTPSIAHVQRPRSLWPFSCSLIPFLIKLDSKFLRHKGVRVWRWREENKWKWGPRRRRVLLIHSPAGSSVGGVAAGPYSLSLRCHDNLSLERITRGFFVVGKLLQAKVQVSHFEASVLTECCQGQSAQTKRSTSACKGPLKSRSHRIYPSACIRLLVFHWLEDVEEWEAVLP